MTSQPRLASTKLSPPSPAVASATRSGDLRPTPTARPSSSPLVYRLLRDGVRRGRAAADERVARACRRLHPLAGDSLDWLRRRAGQSPDVVYLDPMFPERGKAARPRKEMWLFRLLLPGDDDAPELLELALRAARHRVVVKRPLGAPALAARPPGHSLRGRAIRFDVYPLRGLRD